MNKLDDVNTLAWQMQNYMIWLHILFLLFSLVVPCSVCSTLLNKAGCVSKQRAPQSADCEELASDA